jgi:hypothetical protein
MSSMKPWPGDPSWRGFVAHRLMLATYTTLFVSVTAAWCTLLVWGIARLTAG